MRGLRYWALVGILASGAGCSSMPSGPEFREAEVTSNEDGNVYIYRPERLFRRGEPIGVVLEGEQVGEIGNNGYATLSLDPGEYTVHPSSSQIDKETNFRVKPGATTFLRLSLKKKPALCYCSEFWYQAVDREQALEGLAGTRRDADFGGD